MARARGRRTTKGSGLVKSVINHLPVELHIPGYRFAGPGTKLRERLAREERGINSLDELARTHDIAYENSHSLKDRRIADRILEDQAWKMFKSKKTGLKEKAASWLVTTAMKAKRKMGSGCRFKCAVTAEKKYIKNKMSENNIIKLVRTSITAAKKAISKKKKTKTPRIIPISKKGGVLPLIPIFSGLSALGSLTGGIASVVKTIHDIRKDRNAAVRLGKDLYLAPYKNNTYQIQKGDGLYLKPYKSGGTLII